MGAPPPLAAAHRRRLRDLWRSAGWPSRDNIELDLLAAGLLQCERDAAGRETLRVTDAGLRLLADARVRQQAARSAHEALVERVAREMQRAGRVVWRGLALRAPLPGDDADAAATRWVVAMPDVFSIRHTTREDCTEPVVHEIKVRRADLLADLRRSAKGGAYRALASQCWYVLADGIGEPDEVPDCYGVMIARAGGLDAVRAAPKRAMRLPFAVWMALARARAEEALAGDDQGLLGDPCAGPGARSQAPEANKPAGGGLGA